MKTVVYRKVQSGSGHTVIISSAKGFAEYANLVVKEPPKVPGTLQIRHIKRVITNDQAVLSFYKVSPQSGDVIPAFREVRYSTTCNVIQQPSTSTTYPSLLLTCLMMSSPSIRLNSPLIRQSLDDTPDQSLDDTPDQSLINLFQ